MKYEVWRFLRGSREKELEIMRAIPVLHTTRDFLV